ncbi:MAG: carbohydrate kinase family protein [Gammaproteobacteria bacterium]|nr:carbohydrate kinase family protein [Gammaproteobacteria bacterium]MBV8405803.1 carbohydrate kinase family protein [Gammaproteobacteria bacterium]
MGGTQHRLSIIGDVGVDLVLGPISGWPRIGTETVVERSELRAGGSAANAALAVSYLGGKSQLLSVVGNDEPGAWLAHELRPLQAALIPCSAPTTVTVGLIDSCGERTFFTTRGHLEALTYELLRPHIAPAPSANSIALLSGVFLTPALRASYPLLMRELHALGYRVALDTNWPPQDWSVALRAEVGGWISRCEHVLLNDLEVRSLADSEDLGAAIERLVPMLRQGATLVVKMGARGALAIQDGERCEQRAAAASIFDTIGAGDSFNAGYLLARLDGAGLADALAAGCTAATSIIARFPRRAIAAGELAGLRAHTATVLEEQA